MELKIYGSEDIGHLVGILSRSGYKVTTWAELDQANNIVYKVNVSSPSQPESEKVILNE